MGNWLAGPAAPAGASTVVAEPALSAEESRRVSELVENGKAELAQGRPVDEVAAETSSAGLSDAAQAAIIAGILAASKIILTPENIARVGKALKSVSKAAFEKAVMLAKQARAARADGRIIVAAGGFHAWQGGNEYMMSTSGDMYGGGASGGGASGGASGGCCDGVSGGFHAWEGGFHAWEGGFHAWQGGDCYIGAAQHYMRKQGKTGGFHAWQGAAQDVIPGLVKLDVVANYASSTAEGFKDALTADIIKIAEKLNMKITGNTREEQLASFLSKIPKNKQLEPMFEKLCKAIAERINSVYGENIIDMKLPPTYICEQVEDIAKSLRAGLQAEFLQVYSDVQNCLHNMKEMEVALRASVDSTAKRIADSDDELLRQRYSELNNANQSILDEMDRQVAMLKNLLSIRILPMSKSLVEIMKHTNMDDQITRLKAHPTGNNKGVVMYNLLNSIHDTGLVSARVNRALKEIGMSLQEYKALGTIDNLEQRLADVTSRVENDEELHKKLAYAKILISNFNKAGDIEGSHEMRRSSRNIAAVRGAYDDDDLYNGDLYDDTRGTSGGFNADPGGAGGYGGAHQGGFNADPGGAGGYGGAHQGGFNTDPGGAGGYGGAHQGKHHGHHGHQGGHHMHHGGADGDDLPGTAGASGECDSRTGAAEYSDSVMEKRMRDRRDQRNLLFNAFSRQINSAFDKFAASIVQLSNKIGTEIKRSDTLDELRNILLRVQEALVRKKNIYYALIGWYKDPLSTSLREEFLANLAMVSAQIGAILEMPMYNAAGSYFRDVQVNIAGIVKIINQYTDTVKSKFGGVDGRRARARKSKKGGNDFSPAGMNGGGASGGGASGGYTMSLPSSFSAAGGCDACNDDPTKSPADASTGASSGTSGGFHAWEGGADGGFHAWEGGADGGADGGFHAWEGGGASGGFHAWEGGGGPFDEPEIQYKSPDTIADAIRVFDSRLRSAQIRDELKRAAENFSKYNADQEKINPYAIANVVQEEIAKHTRLTELLDAESKDDRFKTVAMSDSASKAEWTEAKRFLDEILATKKNFWRTVETVDMYLREVHSSLVRNPDLAQDVHNMLESVAAIAEWESNAAGNMLAAAFDQYPSVSPVGASAARDGPLKTDGDVPEDTHYYDLVARNAAVAGADAPGLPTATVITPVAARAADDQIKRMFTNMTALKNLLSVFTSFCIKIAGSDLIKRLPLSPADLYGNLIQYLHASAFAQGVNNGALDTTLKDAKPSSWDILPGNPIAKVQTGNWAPGAAPTWGENQSAFRKHWGLIMRVAKSASDLNPSTIPFSFDCEDRYFVMLLKSIAAKILTIAGVCDLLHRPYEYNGISPIRMILGGADDIPTVVDGATALYLRLTLMLQFEREILGFDNNNFEQYPGIPDKNNVALKISMVPSIGGPFSGLITLIFRDLRGVNTDMYTDDNVAAVIRECNSIYQALAPKHPTDTINEIIRDLLAEINQRYGIVSRADRNIYEEDFDRDYERSTYSADSDTEYPLLPGEGDNVPSRMTPSEKLLGENFDKATPKKSKYTVDYDYKRILDKFQCIVARKFADANDNITLTPSIRAAHKRLLLEKNDAARFKIVASLIRGADVHSQVDNMKYAMFQDTVVAGLNALSGIHSMLARFQQRVLMLDVDILRQAVIDARAGGITIMNTSNAAMQLLINSYGLVAHAPNVLPQHLSHILSRILGTDDNDPANGGAGGNVDDVKRRGAMLASYDRGAAGLNQLLAGITNDEIAKYGKMDTAPKDAAEKLKYQRVKEFFRYNFNTDFMMRELLETVYGIGFDCQDFVTVKFSDNQINIGFGGLKKTIDELFASIRYFMDLLRPHIDVALFEQYTDKTIAGSYYWLQEQLIDKIVKGRQTHGTFAEYPSLDSLTRRLSNTWQYLTCKYDGDGSNLQAANIGNPTYDRSSYNSFDKIIAEMIFYDGTKIQSGIMGSEKAGRGADALVVDFNLGAHESLMAAGPPEARVLDTRFAARFKQLYTWDKELTFNRSALFAFNQLVAKYVQSFFDTTTSKMYSGLIAKFAGGTFAQSLNNPFKCYPDTVPLVQVRYSASVKYDNGVANTLMASLTTDEMALADSVVRVIDADLARLGQAAATGYDPNQAGNVPRVADYLRVIPNIGAASLFVGPASLNPGAAAPAAPTALAPYPVGYITNVRSILLLNPFATDMQGRVGTDHDTRVRTLAALIVRYGSSTGGARDIARITNDLKSTASRTVPGVAGSPKTNVPALEFNTVDISNPARTAASTSSGESSMLLFARSEPVVNALEANSINSLRGTPATLADSIASIKTFGNRMDPDNDHVLFASLAVLLRNMTTAKSAAGVASYITENIADLPNYMRERMRANLPAFHTLFHQMQRRCEMLKRAIGRPEFNLERSDATVAAASHNPWPHELKAPVKDSAQTKTRFSGILDTIIRGCVTIVECCTQVLKEVGDVPKHFELYQDSIRDYRAANGFEPFMPLSNILVSLQNVGKTNELALFPVHTLGEEQFQLMYGTRGILANQMAKPTLESNPGFSNTIELFNMLVNKHSTVEKARAQDHLTAFIGAVRFVHAIKHVKGLLTPYTMDGNRETARTNANNVYKLYKYGAFGRMDLVIEATQISGAARVDGPGVPPARDSDMYGGQFVQVSNRSDVSLVNQGLKEGLKNSKVAYAVAKSIADVVRLTSSSERDERIKDFVGWLQPATTTSYDMAVQNIIDLGMIPIDFNAIMREVPLASLYNYSHTFDRLVIELYMGATNTNAKKMIASLCDGDLKILSAKDALVALLIDPYRKIESVDDKQFMRDMLLGVAASGDLGRPKFLSDQLYGKAVFGELYSSAADYNELGPGASAALHLDDKDLFAALFVRLWATAGAAAGGYYALNQDSAYVQMLIRYLLRHPDATYVQIEKDMRGTTYHRGGGATMILQHTIVAYILGTAVQYYIQHRSSATAANEAFAIVNTLLGLTAAAGAFPLPINNVDIPGSVRQKINKDLAGQAAAAIGAPGAAPATAATFSDAMENVPSSQLHYLTDVSEAANTNAHRHQPDNRNVLDHHQVRAVDVGAQKTVIAAAANDRFNTVLVRNLIFIVNVHRAVRTRMMRDAMYSRGKITRGIAAVAPRLTEMYGNELTPSLTSMPY